MLDRRLVGRTTTPGRNLVERGAVRRFADALGEDNPIHRSERAARAMGYPGIVAPPTFPVTFEAGSDLRELLGVANGEVLLAEQVFEYERPIVVGETILVTHRIDEISSRDGISGAMELVVISETGRLTSGEVVYRGRHQLVARV
ncbi:MAG: MaoC family dehydratase N-terminal domain-containing protein [Deltaproteobacteria bacterium]|nr:MaoC family dehydratase N-terminal domain-containing protein [Deltaproteobacteria bacterium]